LKIAIGNSSKHQAVVAYNIPGEADKNQCEDNQYFAIHLFPDGGSRRAEGVVCVHTETDRKPKTQSYLDLSFSWIETTLTCLV
jgi:hypothetical protein